MPEPLGFATKLKKSLYGMGFKNVGPSLLVELRKGGPDWTLFVHGLLEGNDYPSRKVALQQLTAKGFVEKHRNRPELVGLLQEFLAKGLADEKRVVLRFVDANLHLFPKDDDAFRGRILALQREKDVQLSSAAEALLPKIGIDLDNRDTFRRA